MTIEEICKNYPSKDYPFIDNSTYNKPDYVPKKPEYKPLKIPTPIYPGNSDGTKYR